MNRKNWKKIKDILQEVIELDEDERLQHLEGLELKDDIRKEIDSLLSFQDEANRWKSYSAIELIKDSFGEN